MRLISRSVLREIWPPLLLGFAAYTFILLVRTIFLMTEFFVRRSASLSEVGWLVLLSIPWILVLTLPMAFLLGILIGIGRLSADSELIAMRSCGVGPWALYRPALGAAAILSAGVFLFYNLVLPRANDELTRSMARLAATSVVNLVEPRTFREPRAGITLFFDRIGADGRSFEGVFLKLGEDDERNDRVIIARRGALALDGGRLWLDLFSSVVHDVDPANPSRYRTNRNEFQRILFSADIEETVQSRITYEKGLRAQSLPELLKVARRQRSVSPEKRRLALVEIHKKFSIPFACFAFAFVGIPLADTFRRGGRGSGFAISLAILVVYYVLISNGESWAQDGRMSPALAMWLPNLVLIGVGLLASRRAGRERGRWTLSLRRRRKMAAATVEPSRRAWFSGILRFPALLDRYVLARFFSTLLLVFASVLLLSIVVDYSDKADEILTNRPPGAVVAGYYQAFLLGIAMDLAPFAVLIATLVCLGIFSKNNEDTAFKASGVSVRRLGAPIFVAAALGAFLAFSLGEYALPIAKQKEIRYRNRISGHPADWKLRTPAERNWYYARDGRIWHREESEGSGVLASPSIYQFDSAFELVRRTTAREATWDPVSRTWVLRQGWTRELRGSETISFATFLEERTAGDPPSAFSAEHRSPEEMRFRELQRYTRRLQRTGYPTAALETALHSKIARPLLLPVMALLGIPFAFRIGKRGALAGIGVGLVLGMAFLIASALFTKLGDVGALPPPLAAWSPHVLFSTAACFLLARLRT